MQKISLENLILLFNNIEFIEAKYEGFKQSLIEAFKNNLQLPKAMFDLYISGNKDVIKLKEGGVFELLADDFKALDIKNQIEIFVANPDIGIEDITMKIQNLTRLLNIGSDDFNKKVEGEIELLQEILESEQQQQLNNSQHQSEQQSNHRFAINVANFKGQGGSRINQEQDQPSEEIIIFLEEENSQNLQEQNLSRSRRNSQY